MDTEPSNKINPKDIDFDNIDFDALSSDQITKFEKAKRLKGLDLINHNRIQLFDQEMLHLHGDLEYIDSYGQTVYSLAKSKGKEGVSLTDLKTIMQPDLLVRAIKNLVDNGKIVVKKLFADGKDSGNKKFIYLPEDAPQPKQS
jgi:hypothetical protein